MNDIWTMIWKESKDLLFQGGWKASIRPLLLIGIMGIYLPLQGGIQWLALSPIEMFVILWIPFSVIVSFIGDAIAGERERHTLETLLASRVSDRAILLGKVVVTVGYAWGMALGGLLLGLMLVNLFRGNGGGWMFYHPLDLLLEALALSLLTCLLGASAGVLVSLRTSTVRQAQQILGIGTFVLVFGGISALQALPANFVASLTYSQFLLLVMAVIAVLDAFDQGEALLTDIVASLDAACVSALLFGGQVALDPRQVVCLRGGGRDRRSLQHRHQRWSGRSIRRPVARRRRRRSQPSRSLAFARSCTGGSRWSGFVPS